jgi:hypothetical protein
MVKRSRRSSRSRKQRGGNQFELIQDIQGANDFDTILGAIRQLENERYILPLIAYALERHVTMLRDAEEAAANFPQNLAPNVPAFNQRLAEAKQYVMGRLQGAMQQPQQQQQQQQQNNVNNNNENNVEPANLMNLDNQNGGKRRGSRKSRKARKSRKSRKSRSSRSHKKRN